MSTTKESADILARNELLVLDALSGTTNTIDILDKTGLSQTTVGRVLRLLTACGVVEKVRRGRYKIVEI